MSSIYGYIRVSSKDQKEERQLVTMREKDKKRHYFSNIVVVCPAYGVQNAP